MPGPEAINYLRKVYRKLKLDPKDVVTDVQALAGVTSVVPGSKSAKFVLDEARLKQKQDESDQVKILLDDVFAGDDAVAPAHDTDAGEAEESEGGDEVDDEILPALPKGTVRLAQLLLEKAAWPQAEAVAAARSAGVPLGGAVESLNDFCFDALGEPLIEGDPDLEVRIELKERFLKAAKVHP